MGGLVQILAWRSSTGFSLVSGITFFRLQGQNNAEVTLHGAIRKHLSRAPPSGGDNGVHKVPINPHLSCHDTPTEHRDIEQEAELVVLPLSVPLDQHSGFNVVSFRGVHAACALESVLQPCTLS